MFMQVRALEGVKPSAQPTLVRTQHLPLAAEMARDPGNQGSRAILV